MRDCQDLTVLVFQELGEDLIAQLHQSHPHVPLLILRSVHTPQEALKAIRAGAQGYVLKSTVQKELSRAVMQLHAGGSPINPRIAFELLAEFRSFAVPEPEAPSAVDKALSALSSKLSYRETDVLKLMARGYADKEDAARLGISPSTVDTHVRAIFRKFSVHSRSQLRKVIGV